MTKRQQYLDRMRATLDQMEVKAGLAKLELRDVRDALGKEYDGIVDRLHRLGDASGTQWDALKAGLESAWTSFQGKYKDTLARHTTDG